MMFKKVLSTIILLMFVTSCSEKPKPAASNTDVVHKELPVESIPKSLSLPATYPDSWVFAHDINYNTMLLGQFVILDVAAQTRQFKGLFQGAQLASFTESKRRSEFYVAETFYTRGHHGKRTDVLTVYDKVQLSPKTEIILPAGKRALITPHKGLLQLTNDEKFALVFNFTPAGSVSVVDLEQRKFVNEVPIPGCTLSFPSGERGFSTLCGNGTLASVVLDDKGQVLSEHISEVFNTIDSDPLFMEAATVQGVTYFPSFLGRIQPIDMTTNQPTIQPSWSVLSTEDKAESWRPSGAQPIASNGKEKLYVLMRKNAVDGNHYAGGEEVWVFDPNTQKRLSRIKLQQGGNAIEITRGQHPYLVVSTARGVDVYNANTGKFLRYIGGQGGFSALHASR